jgi:hypothetical protein
MPSATPFMLDDQKETDHDPVEYLLDLMRDGEITSEKFADDLRSIGDGNPEITEILAGEA